MRRLILALLLMLGLISVITHASVTRAHASEPYGCITYEDDSFVCGTLEPSHNGDEPWGVNRLRPWISGCIPGGQCDTPDTQDQPYSEVIYPDDWPGWDIDTP